MKLYLHVGTEKTGSSYLQKLCGVNRSHLHRHGIFFPDAGRDERRLIMGTISPGNARELAELIESESWASVSRWLSSRIRAAENQNCDRLLLSHELLFAVLSSDGSVKHFASAAIRAGATSLHTLLMIRDPVDQAVSLYKHRAKNGTAGEIGDWIEDKYKTVDQLDGFMRQIEGKVLHLYLRKYVKDANLLSSIFFGDWLGIQNPPQSVESIVNPSLTLSELQLIRSMALSRPETTPLFYSKLLAVPYIEKATDVDLEEAARAVAENYLCRFSDFWGDMNLRLQSDGGITIPKRRSTSSNSNCATSFSQAQIDAWISGHNESHGYRHKVDLLLSRCRRWIGPIIRKCRTVWRRRVK